VSRFVFDGAPRRVYWELTRACDLACRHCRAEAVPGRDPGELDTAEGRRLLEALCGFGEPRPHVVLTGGDPLKRPDFWDLLAHGVRLGLDVAVAPSGTPSLTGQVVTRFATAGAHAMSLSLDGADAAGHDGFRGIPGCFERTLEAGRAAVAAGLSLQVNTLVTAATLADLPRIHALVAGLGAARWSLFFLVQVGRGRGLQQLTPATCERVLAWAAAQPAPPAVTATEAPHSRRVTLQRLRAGGVREAPPGLRHAFGIRDGNGILFVSHGGDVQPSGFLPLVAGNVRREDVVAIYRDAPLFRALREPAGFGGRCGRCEFRDVCGGSRARAFAATGDPLAEDPLCAYEPAAGCCHGGTGRYCGRQAANVLVQTYQATQADRLMVSRLETRY
jgi:MoaA/NifB/PqqE/SkfB family radical SAM enzyme